MLLDHATGKMTNDMVFDDLGPGGGSKLPTGALLPEEVAPFVGGGAGGSIASALSAAGGGLFSGGGGFSGGGPAGGSASVAASLFGGLF